jgi:hypothetical protein
MTIEVYVVTLQELVLNKEIQLFQLLDNKFKSEILFLIHFDTNAS